MDDLLLGEGLTVTSTLFRALESGEAIRAAVVEEEVELEEVEAMWASSSCSCWSALTNAAFRRLVCSAFRAFLTLVVTQLSHITLTSLPKTWKFIFFNDMLLTFVPLAALSHFHVGVKSVPHWLQLNGTGCMLFSLSSLRILETHSSRPNKQMNSVLAGFGMKCISGGGGLGGGI